MQKNVKTLLLSDIRTAYTASDEEILHIAKERMKRLCRFGAGLHFRLYKKSLDARNKKNVLFVSSVLAEFSEPCEIDDALFPHAHARVVDLGVPEPVFGNERLGARPLIVGMGPAGLFAALELARAGYAPLIIDRGDGVAERARKTELFRVTGTLDTESNVQFGAGGAGTFSDGKLITRVNDAYCHYILEQFVRHGAPRDILIQAKPHLGTDLLRGVVEGMLSEITRLGGEVRYRTKLLDYTRRGGEIIAETSAGDLSAGVLLLGIGHSARDTFFMLARHTSLVCKPFSVGVRIEHRREDIERALFGDLAGDARLGAAEYALSDTTLPRGVYTFCMCPGGVVIPAASEEGGVVVNGMSYHSRDGENSNAALAVSVSPEDVGNDPFGAIAFQRDLERRAFAAGGGSFVAPAETVGDFLDTFRGSAPARILPTYGGGRVKMTDLTAFLPRFVSENLAAGIRSFDRKLAGFAAPDAILTGVESRTSSPLRIPRTEDRRAVGDDLLYPMGEGAGYAGGITSAALDGLHTALAVMRRFAPLR